MFCALCENFWILALLAKSKCLPTVSGIVSKRRFSQNSQNPKKFYPRRVTGAEYPHPHNLVSREAEQIWKSPSVAGPFRGRPSERSERGRHSLPRAGLN